LVESDVLHAGDAPQRDDEHGAHHEQGEKPRSASLGNERAPDLEGAEADETDACEQPEAGSEPLEGASDQIRQGLEAADDNRTYQQHQRFSERQRGGFACSAGVGRGLQRGQGPSHS